METTHILLKDKNSRSGKMSKYGEPDFQGKAFNCPHCEVFAKQNWFKGAKASTYQSKQLGPQPVSVSYSGLADGLNLCYCDSCNKYSIWVNGDIIYPKSSKAPLPYAEMPEDVKKDYLEARTIINESPRGAGALLRLALQKLMPHLGEEGKNIDHDIGNLFKKGLSVDLKQAFDSVRVIGNESVHPGEIDITDNSEIVITLFDLLNIIVEEMIIKPKKIMEMYGRLPKNKKEGIENRDRNV